MKLSTHEDVHLRQQLSDATVHDLLCQHPMLVQISNELDVAKGSSARLHKVRGSGSFTVYPTCICGSAWYAYLHKESSIHHDAVPCPHASYSRQCKCNCKTVQRQMLVSNLQLGLGCFHILSSLLLLLLSLHLLLRVRYLSILPLLLLSLALSLQPVTVLTPWAPCNCVDMYDAL